MTIDQAQYDRLPLAIQQGALQLWGKKLGDFQDGDLHHQLFQINTFFVLYEEPVGGQTARIRTYSSTQLVDYVLKRVQASSTRVQRNVNEKAQAY